MKTAQETSGTTLNTPNICIIEVPEGEEREKGPEKMFAEIIAEQFPEDRKGNSQVQEAQSPRKDKPKEEHRDTQ